jgi:putative two-component system response regulator
MQKWWEDTMKTIIIVDDDPGVRYTIKNGLEELDAEYKVLSAESGQKCLEILQNDLIPDVILLDIMMPEMSGWETLNRIKENASWRDIPIIFLTARTDDTARNAGSFLAEDYIEKPCKIPELKQRIEKIISHPS